MTKARPMARPESRAADVLAAAAPPHQGAEHHTKHGAGQQAAGEQRRDRYAGHRADGDQHDGCRDGPGLRAGRGKQGQQVALIGAARLHLGEQHRGDRRHVRRLGARYPRDEIHRAHQHIGQAAPHAAQQAGQEADHGAGHPGHLDQQTQQDEQRHGQENDLAHTLIHPPDQHQRGQMRGQGEVAEGGRAEGEGDRHAGEHQRRHQRHEEDEQIVAAQAVQHGTREVEVGGNHDRGCQRGQRHAPGPLLHQTDDTDQQHQDDAGGQRGGMPGAGNFQRRRRDRYFVAREVDGGIGHEAQETDADRQRQSLEIAAPGLSRGADDGRHPHVFRASEGDDGAHHGKPDELRGGQLVRPQQGIVEHVSADHAKEQHDHLGNDQNGRKQFDGQADPTIDQAKRRQHGTGGADRGRRGRGVSGHLGVPPLA